LWNNEGALFLHETLRRAFSLPPLTEVERAEVLHSQFAAESHNAGVRKQAAEKAAARALKLKKMREDDWKLFDLGEGSLVAYKRPSRRAQDAPNPPTSWSHRYPSWNRALVCTACTMHPRAGAHGLCKLCEFYSSEGMTDHLPSGGGGAGARATAAGVEMTALV
jgi:hypothetical protein